MSLTGEQQHTPGSQYGDPYFNGMVGVYMDQTSYPDQLIGGAVSDPRVVARCEDLQDRLVPAHTLLLSALDTPIGYVNEAGLARELTGLLPTGVVDRLRVLAGPQGLKGYTPYSTERQAQRASGHAQAQPALTAQAVRHLRLVPPVQEAAAPREAVTIPQAELAEPVDIFTAVARGEAGASAWLEQEATRIREARGEAATQIETENPHRSTFLGSLRREITRVRAMRKWVRRGLRGPAPQYDEQMQEYDRAA